MAQEGVDWIFDFVLEVLKSPEWEVPVMSFIDANCAVFDTEDENKLAYTDVHDQFRSVVDDVLTQKLAEVGVSAEDFAKACEAAAEARHTNRTVFDQLMAIDDFRVFKKMMVKRNNQLQLQAVEALKREQAAAAARAKAEADAEAEAKARAAEAEDEAKQQERAAQAELDAAEKERQALADAAAATLQEMELLQRQEEMEQRAEEAHAELVFRAQRLLTRRKGLHWGLGPSPGPRLSPEWVVWERHRRVLLGDEVRSLVVERARAAARAVVAGVLAAAAAEAVVKGGASEAQVGPAGQTTASGGGNFALLAGARMHRECMGGTGAGSPARQPQPASTEQQNCNSCSFIPAGGSHHQDTDAPSTPFSTPTPRSSNSSSSSGSSS